MARAFAVVAWDFFSIKAANCDYTLGCRPGTERTYPIHVAKFESQQFDRNIATK